MNNHTAANRELQSSEIRYRRLFESARDGILILDAVNRKITDANPFMVELLGYSRDEFLGKELWEIGLLEDEEVSKAAFRELKENGFVRYEDLPLETKAGVRRELEFVSSVYTDGDRQVIQCNIRDITERKAAAEAWQGSELRYRRLFESAKDGILILDADTGQIIDANPYLMEALGYSYEELVGKELWEIGFFEDIAAAKKAFEELQDKSYVRYDDLPLKTRGGRLIEVEIVSNVYLVGKSKVIQCNIRDITERKLGKRTLEETNRKLETTLGELSATTQQLWQASKLATMGELSASIAHELNNPLTTVALRVENLLLQMADDDQKRRSLEIIAQEVDRMANLIDNLLQFSRRSHRQVSTVDVREEIANSVEFVHYHLRTRKIEVRREFADSLPTIQADRQQLRQLFLNLLTNASDAMPQGGTLTVRANASVLNETEAVQIDFADTGEGIAAENLNKIWDPFFTSKAERKGTGLGLAICRRIVEEHGGAIEIESETECGTTVRMLFPATANGAPANLR